MYIYIYVLTPHQDLPFFDFTDCFIARSTYLLSAPPKKTNTKKNKKRNNALESLLPSPHPKEGHPKLCFFCVFFVLFKNLIPRNNPD